MISVCIAIHNGEKYITEQLDSILCQLDVDDEIIISDDGSTDKSLDLVEKFGDSRIRVIHYKQQQCVLKRKHAKGFYCASANFENALKEARGEIIILSDQDDIWNENKVEILKTAMRNYDIVQSNYAVIDGDGHIKCDCYLAKSPVYTSFIKNVLTHPFMGCCMAFSKEVLQYSLPFPKLVINHDCWIGCLAVRRFRYGFIETPLIKYRRTGNNLSQSTQKSEHPIWFKIWYRLEMLISLLKHISKEERRNEE